MPSPNVYSLRPFLLTGYSIWCSFTFWSKSSFCQAFYMLPSWLSSQSCHVCICTQTVCLWNWWTLAQRWITYVGHTHMHTHTHTHAHTHTHTHTRFCNKLERFCNEGERPTLMILKIMSSSHLLTITSNDSVNTGYPDPMNSAYSVKTAPERLTSSTTSVRCATSWV